jgi:AcrR family transcriptional regulator
VLSEPSAPAGADAAPARLLGEKPLTYSSPAIIERRRRILEESRKMISEGGLDGFNMGELCKRAGVAKRTLYNAFQTKERIISIAISEYSEEYVERIPFSSPVGTLQRNLERLISVCQRNLKIRNYVSAIMTIYFSREVSPDIWTTMNSMATRPTLQWLERLQAKRQLQPWIDARQLADDVVRYEYATINDWCQGRLQDHELVPRLVMSFLTFMAGATRGAARAEIEAMILQIQENGVPKVPPVSAGEKRAALKVAG